jgi:hypothetical protein
VRFSSAFVTAAFISTLSKNSPFRICFVIATDSWSTIRPAPMFWCPTSLLPIVPSGRPTSNPLV